MATLTLSPAAREARAARQAASGKPAPSAAPPTPLSTSRGAFPATQVKVAVENPRSQTSSNKATKKAGMAALREKLRRVWPHLFAQADVPLAIGIRHDIAKHLSAEEVKLLSAVLHQHTHRPAYINALMQPGAHRCGLDGSLAPVSVEQAEHARALMEASS